MTEYFIALDVHCAFSEMAVMTGSGKIVRRDRFATAIPALSKAISEVRRPRRLTFEQEDSLRGELIGLAKNEEPVRRFQELPGFAWIRAVTFYAYIETPWRFKSKSALWRYSGIGLERRHSGAGFVKTRLSRGGNRRLKDVLLGAAKSAVAQTNNPFADKFQYWIEEEGIPVPHARRNVARCLASVLWSLWKTGKRYDSGRVRVPSRTARR